MARDVASEIRAIAQERILVAITPRSDAGRMLESGRRNADRFHGELLAEERLGMHRAWRVPVSGTASFCGTATWIVEQGDRLGDGFAIEDGSPLPVMA